MQKHINKKKKTDTRTGKTAVKKKNSRSKRRKSSRVRQRNQRILMSLMLLVIIVLSGWIIINRASENGWSIGDFLHNSDTMISDGEQSGTDNTDSSGSLLLSMVELKKRLFPMSLLLKMRQQP